MMPDDTRTDDALVDAANQGDPTAFETLYYRYRDWAVRMAYRFTADHTDALDVLQETFTYFAKKFPGFRLRAKVTTFLYPVVKHIAVRLRQKRSRLVSDDAVATQTAVWPKPDYAASRRELAAALRIRLGTVKSRLHNALKSLRRDPRTRRYFDL